MWPYYKYVKVSFEEISILSYLTLVIFVSPIISHSCYFLKVPACLPSTKLPTTMVKNSGPYETISPNKLFLLQVALVIVSYNDSRKVAKIAILL